MGEGRGEGRAGGNSVCTAHRGGAAVDGDSTWQLPDWDRLSLISYLESVLGPF